MAAWESGHGPLHFIYANIHANANANYQLLLQHEHEHEHAVVAQRGLESSQKQKQQPPPVPGNSLRMYSQALRKAPVGPATATAKREKQAMTANTSGIAAKKQTFLKKPVPAVMCASQQCQVRACLEHYYPPANDNATATQSIAEFMRPFPSPHYGYGFIHRHEGNRGLGMQTSGMAKSGSGCAISHKYEFIFVHVLKSGGTTLKGFLQTALCGNTTLPCAAAMGGTHTLQIVDCAAAIKRYPHYFAFSFVRNPYPRMYSIYAMAKDFTKSMLKPFSFDSFVLGGSHHPNTTKSDNNSTATTTKETTTIQQKYLFRKNLTVLHPSHFFPQTNFLFTPKGCPVVDFIGHLETIHDDLQKVLTYINSTELWQHFHKDDGNGNSNNYKKVVRTDQSTAFGARQKQKELAGGNLQIAYHYRQQQSADADDGTTTGNHRQDHRQHQHPWSALQKAVVEEYKRDFYLLGYNPNLVPP